MAAWRNHPEYGLVPHQDVQAFVSRTLAVMITAPRRLGIAYFSAQKKQLLPSPYLDHDAIRNTIFGPGKNPAEIVTQYESSSTSSLYASPIPSLPRLSAEQQVAVVGHLTEEAQKLYDLTRLYNLVAETAAVTRPVLLRPVDQLRQAIEEGVDPKQAFRAFFETTTRFEALQESIARGGPENHHRSFFERLEAGEEIALTEPDQPIPLPDVETQTNAVILEVTKALYALTGDEAPLPKLIKWNLKRNNVAEQLLSGSRAARSNLMVIDIPLDDVELAKYLDDWTPTEVPVDTARRLRFSIDLKSSGKPITLVMVELLLYARHRPGEDRPALERKIINRAAGTKQVRDMIAESKANAERIMAWRATHPFRGGAPGLGKRR